MNKIFRKFRGKLMAEAIFKSLLMGVLIGSCVELVFLIAMHLVSRDPGWILIGCVFAIPFSAAFLLFFMIAYYPTPKRIAKRLDRQGLKDRAGTMLEFKDKDSAIHQMQREDAAERIKRINPREIPFRIAPKPVISCLIAVGLSVGGMFVPYDIMSMLRADASTVDEEQAAMIRGLIEALRKATAEGDVPDSFKEPIYRSIDELETDLDNAVGEFDKVAQLSEAEYQIKEVLEGEISKKFIGFALRQLSSTVGLGQAIEKCDTEATAAALEKMRSEILSEEKKGQAAKLAEISSDIEKALSASGIAESDPLYTALDTFSDKLHSAAETAALNLDSSNDIEEAIKKAESEINPVITEQYKFDSLLENLLKLLREAKNRILFADYDLWETEQIPEEDLVGETAETEQTPTETGDPMESNAPSSEKPDGDGDGESENSESQPSNGEYDDGTAPSDGVIYSMTEGIYDPSLGSVTYGEVFAAYYAEYLAALNDGDIPADAQDVVEKYFESLNK